MRGHRGVLIQDISKALKLRIFPAGAQHLHQKTVTALQVGAQHRVTVANKSPWAPTHAVGHFNTTRFLTIWP